MRGFTQMSGRANHVGDARINTGLSVRDGEKVVVGTAKLRDKTIILALTAKALK